MPSNLTSFCPDDSDTESYGAIGLRTAKLSPNSDDASGAMAEHPGPMLSTELRHPYSGMSLDDYNVEPTGILGLTTEELVSVGNDFTFGTTPPGLDQDERLFTSTISRPTSWVPVVQDQDHIRTDLNRRCQEMLDTTDPRRSGQSIPLSDATSYDCRRPGNVLHPKRALTFRHDFTGALVRMPNFVQCNCDRCQKTVNPADAVELSPAKRKPTPSWEGSRDQSDVLTLTDVTTRPPMFVAGGAEMLGVEVSCPSEASPQDVRPVVSTADATVHNQVTSTADAMLLSQVMSPADAIQLGQVTSSADATTFGQNGTELTESAATTLILCDGSTRIPRSQLVNDAELSIDENR